MDYTPPQRAFRDFTARYSPMLGVRSVETGSYEGELCIVAMVDEGFASDRLPAGFMGYPVLLNDGVRGYQATGALI